AQDRADPVVAALARHRQRHQHRRGDVLHAAAVRRLHLSRHPRRTAAPDLERARHGHATTPAVVENPAAGVVARDPHRIAPRTRLLLRHRHCRRDDRRQHRHRQADVHLRRERCLRLHVRGGGSRGRARLCRRPSHGRHLQPAAALGRRRESAGLMRALHTIGASLWRGIAAAYPLILLAIVWEAVARLGYVRPVFLPPLSAVFAQFWPLAAGGDLVQPLLVSLYRAAAGLALAIGLGVAIGFLMARMRVVRWLLDPLIAFSFPSPKIAFLPIFILWFGIDHLAKIALVAFTCIFPFIVAAYAGATTVPTHQLWAARAMGTSNL